MSINEVSHDKSNAHHVKPTETEKIDLIPQAIEEMKVENNSTKVIALTAHIDTINHDYEEILDSLNLEGEKHGVQFKRGKTHYYNDAKVKYKAIVVNTKICMQPKTNPIDKRNLTVSRIIQKFQNRFQRSKKAILKRKAMLRLVVTVRYVIDSNMIKRIKRNSN